MMSFHSWFFILIQSAIENFLTWYREEFWSDPDPHFHFDSIFFYSYETTFGSDHQRYNEVKEKFEIPLLPRTIKTRRMVVADIVQDNSIRVLFWHEGEQAFNEERQEWPKRTGYDLTDCLHALGLKVMGTQQQREIERLNMIPRPGRS